MTEEELNIALISIYDRLRWIEDNTERSQWIKNSVGNQILASDWSRLVWVIEDILDKLESFGGRPFVAHMRPCSRQMAQA